MNCERDIIGGTMLGMVWSFGCVCSVLVIQWGGFAFWSVYPSINAPNKNLQSQHVLSISICLIHLTLLNACNQQSDWVTRCDPGGLKQRTAKLCPTLPVVKILSRSHGMSSWPMSVSWNMLLIGLAAERMSSWWNDLPVEYEWAGGVMSCCNMQTACHTPTGSLKLLAFPCV